MTWSDAFTAAQRHELLSNISDHEPKTAVAYVTLKTHLAMRGPAGLWADERHLASLARCTRSWWRNRAWPALMHLFVERDGRLFAADDWSADGAASAPAVPRFLRAASVKASNAGNARWAKHRKTQEAPSEAAGAVPGEHAPSMPQAYAQACSDDGESMGWACGNDAQNDAPSMPQASVEHAQASPPAPECALSLSSDSVLSDSDAKPASKEESAREGERARAGASGTHDAQAYAQACLSDVSPRNVGDARASSAPALTRAEKKRQKWLASQERKAKNPPRAPMIPLPDDWQPNAAGRALAGKKGHDADVLAEHFRVYYRRRDDRMADWDAGFESWVHREPVFDPDRLKQAHLTMPIAGGTAGQPKAAALPEDDAAKARVAAAEAWAPPDLVAQWARVRGQVRVRVGPVAYRTWLADMALGALDGDEVVVHLPDAFVRDHVAKEYGGHLTQLWRAERSDIRRVELRAAPSRPARAASPEADEPGKEGYAAAG